MAELVNLHQADKHWKNSKEDILRAKKMLEGLKMGSDPQVDVLHVLLGAVGHLANCLGEVMHNNRDGRGTKSGWDTLRGR